MIRRKKSNVEQDDVDKIASVPGCKAVKCFDSRRNPTMNYSFSQDRALDVKENTTICLLCQHPRLEIVVAKVNAE